MTTLHPIYTKAQQLSQELLDMTLKETKDGDAQRAVQLLDIAIAMQTLCDRLKRLQEAADCKAVCEFHDRVTHESERNGLLVACKRCGGVTVLRNLCSHCGEYVA